MINIEIDGIKLEVLPGQMIIEAADLAGIPIPRFCYHKKLSVAANCRMCLVEVAKAPKALPACATPVSEGMVIHTCSDKAKQAQRAVMEFLLINHPLDCPVCDQGGECELQDVAMGYGPDISRYTEGKRVILDKDIGPLISTELTRCIHCTRCVRFGTEIAGMRELGATGRGEHMTIGTFIAKSVDSELSGNVIDLCPVGALTSKPFKFRARSWEMEQHRSVAAHDCIGSNLYYHTWRGQVMRAVPAENNSINEVWLSDRDRFSYEGIASEDRLKDPMMKVNGEWKTVTWPFAMKHVEEKLKQLVNELGATQIGGLASANATNEESYLFQKLMRGLGSPHVDHRIHQRDFSDDTSWGLYPHLGISLETLEEQERVLLIGSYARKAQPLFANRLRKMINQGGGVIAINPIGHDWHIDIDEWVPESANLVSGLAQVAKALCTLKPEAKPELLSELATFLKEVSPSSKAQAIASDLASKQKISLILGDYLDAHPEASTLRYLAHSIAILLGATYGSLTYGANSAGAWIAGMVPHRLAGGANAKVIGLNAAEQFKKLKAFILLNIEPELDVEDAHSALEGLKAAEWVLSITPYVTETMKSYADVLLPMAVSAETGGSFVNAEGRWQFFKGASKPQGEARPAWKILRVMGNFLSLPGFEFSSVEQVLSELKEKIDNKAQKLNYLVPKTLDGISTKTTSSTLIRIKPLAPYQSDNVVRRSRALQETVDMKKAAKVGVSPALAKSLGVLCGDLVKVSMRTSTQKSPSGKTQSEAELMVYVDAKLPANCVNISHCTSSAALGRAYDALEIERVGV